MITSIQQAKAVQSKRVALTKQGVAKAVRRFLLREHSADYKVKKSELSSLVPKKHQ